jgi:hypothetical protein
MKVERATPGARGVDTIIQFGAERARAIKANGFDYVVRYLGVLNRTERDVILGAGLGLLAVTYSRRVGWVPSAELGDLDGVHAVSNARVAGLPGAMSLYCDLEGPSGYGRDSIAYVNAWATRVQAAGYTAGLYVGFGIPLTGTQLYKNLKVTGYWDSCSVNPTVAERGFQMFQHSPPNQKVAGTLVDVNHIAVDQKGDTPNWLIGAP